MKLIVTDLDGTLLRRDKTISDYTASVFRRCHDAGHKIVFATARPIRTVAGKFLLNIDVDACIYHNGAVVHINGSAFKQTGIEFNAARKLLEAAKKLNGVRISAEISDTHYANFDAAAIWPGNEFTFTDFSDLPELPADKIIFGTADKTSLKELELLLGDDLYWEVSENEILMVMNRNARKLNAVNDVAAFFNVPLSDVIAFGDDYNDVEMLAGCGVGVAVANAVPEAKRAADFICEDCDEDGVAKWLEREMFKLQ